MARCFRSRENTTRSTRRSSFHVPSNLHESRYGLRAHGLTPGRSGAARYEGVVPISTDIEKDLTPADTRAIIDFIKLHRHTNQPFEVVHTGNTTGKSQSQDAEVVGRFADAGATWWFESPLPWRLSFEEVRTRIRSGPPRL